MNIDPSGHAWYNPLTWDWGEIAKGVGLVITGVAAIAGIAICGIYGATHITLSAARSTPRTGNAHSAVYNKQFNTLTYYGKSRQMKYSMHLFNRGHQWVHWHTELPHSQPINNFLRFVWEMAKRGF